MKTSYATLLACTVLALGAATLPLAACGSQPAGPVLTAQDRLLLDEAKHQEETRSALKAAPWKYIVAESDSFQVYDEGILNTYTKVTKIPMQNRSAHDVRALEGEVEVLRADGSLLGKLPVVFKGELLAGQARVMDVETPTIKGEGRTFRLKVTSAQLYSR